MSFRHLILIFIFVYSIFAISVNAAELGFGIEPYIGYGIMGSNAIGSSTPDSYSSALAGARVSVKLLNLLFVGADGSLLANNAYSPGNPTSGVSYSSFSEGRLGAVAGVELPLGFRFWIGYNFIDTMQYNGIAPATLAVLTYHGSSIKVGAGYKILSFLSLNAEYIMNTFSSADLAVTYAGISIPLPSQSLNPAMTGKILLFSVSAPFSIW